MGAAQGDWVPGPCSVTLRGGYARILSAHPRIEPAEVTFPSIPHILCRFLNSGSRSPPARTGPDLLRYSKLLLEAAPSVTLVRLLVDKHVSARLDLPCWG